MYCCDMVEDAKINKTSSMPSIRVQTSWKDRDNQNTVLPGLSLGLAKAENFPQLALMTKINSFQIQSVASSFFMTMATEPKRFVYNYCISKQGHVVEKFLMVVEKRE